MRYRLQPADKSKVIGPSGILAGGATERALHLVGYTRGVYTRMLLFLAAVCYIRVPVCATDPTALYVTYERTYTRITGPTSIIMYRSLCTGHLLVPPPRTPSAVVEVAPS